MESRADYVTAEMGVSKTATTTKKALEAGRKLGLSLWKVCTIFYGILSLYRYWLKLCPEPLPEGTDGM